jgi:hypothetical protein
MTPEVTNALIALGGIVMAGLGTAVRLVYTRVNSKADRTDERVSELTTDLLDCHKLHAETNERIGKLEGWREGYEAHKAKSDAERNSD